MIGKNYGYLCVNQSGCRYPGGCSISGCKDKFQPARYNEPEYVKRIEDRLDRIEKLILTLSKYLGPEI